MREVSGKRKIRAPRRHGRCSVSCTARARLRPGARRCTRASSGVVVTVLCGGPCPPRVQCFFCWLRLWPGCREVASALEPGSAAARLRLGRCPCLSRVVTCLQPKLMRQVRHDDKAFFGRIFSEVVERLLQPWSPAKQRRTIDFEGAPVLVLSSDLSSAEIEATSFSVMAPFFRRVFVMVVEMSLAPWSPAVQRRRFDSEHARVCLV